jgi:hypothetical protein
MVLRARGCSVLRELHPVIPFEANALRPYGHTFTIELAAQFRLEPAEEAFRFTFCCGWAE